MSELFCAKINIKIIRLVRFTQFYFICAAGKACFYITYIN